MVNFQELIQELTLRGYDYQQIADKVDSHRTNIYMLHTGRNQEPRYHLGKELVDLERRTRRRKKPLTV